MIRVYMCFMPIGFCMHRLFLNFEKYLPSDIEIVDGTWMQKHLTIKRDYDLVIGHGGRSDFRPYWAFISPKAVLCESTDDAVLSYFTDKDIMFSYEPERVEYALSKGVNAVLWPRPVDPEIFYPELMEREYTILSVGAYHGGFQWASIAEEVVKEIGGKHIALSPTPVQGVANTDVCWPGRHDDKMRKYYCSSKYVLSLGERGEYMPGLANYGHETGNVEAAFCGTKPIIWDEPDAEYLKYWWGDFATYIKEDGFKQRLLDIVTQPYEPLSEAARQAAFDKYNAKKVCDDFWAAVRGVLNV